MTDEVRCADRSGEERGQSRLQAGVDRPAVDRPPEPRPGRGRDRCNTLTWTSGSPRRNGAEVAVELHQALRADRPLDLQLGREGPHRDIRQRPAGMRAPRVRPSRRRVRAGRGQSRRPGAGLAEAPAAARLDAYRAVYHITCEHGAIRARGRMADVEAGGVARHGIQAEVAVDPVALSHSTTWPRTGAMPSAGNTHRPLSATAAAGRGATLRADPRHFEHPGEKSKDEQ